MVHCAPRDQNYTADICDYVKISPSVARTNSIHLGRADQNELGALSFAVHLLHGDRRSP